MAIYIIIAVALVVLYFLYRRWRGKKQRIETTPPTPVIIVGDSRTKKGGCGTPIVFVVFLLILAIGVIAWLFLSK